MAKARIVPLAREQALAKFMPENLIKLAIEKNWITGTVELNGRPVPFYNAGGLLELLEVPYKNDKGDTALITIYWNGDKICSGGAPTLLFNRNLLAKHPDKPVLIVEGTKRASIATKLLSEYVVVTWNGPLKKHDKADWSLLAEREVKIHFTENDAAWDAAYAIQSQLNNAKVIYPNQDILSIKENDTEALSQLTEWLEICDNYPDTREEDRRLKEKFSKTSTIVVEEKHRDTSFFPFLILGVADDGKGYFLDRHGRLSSMGLGSITQNKLLTLAPLSFWQNEFGTAKGIGRDDWVTATDAVIQLTGQVDFDPERIRGRGAWREKDGRICYHNGRDTIGDSSSKRLYLRMTPKDIGLDTFPLPEKEQLAKILHITSQMSFETRADMIRCIAWSTLAPFCGAMPWRPGGLLTGRSESGKSTIVDMLIKPLSQPRVFSGGETTEAGVRQAIKNDACAIVIEEAETDTPKKRQRRDDILSLMRQSTSDETPKAAKGTIDGKGMMFTLRSMFMFVAISPEVESIADDNRLFRVNLERNENDWPSLKEKLGKLLTEDVCAGVRAFTWQYLKDIFTLADRMSPTIQEITGKSARFALAEAMLFAAYQIVWKQAELSKDDLTAFFEKIYEWQPPEEPRDETEELLDRLLDEPVQEGKDRFPLRVVLQKMEAFTETDLWKNVAGRHGLGLTPEGDLAMAKNHHMISRIIERGKQYQRIFWRHPKLLTKARSVSIAGKVRNCLVLDKVVLTEEATEEKEPF
jgi:putative DNA primase/helicase